MREEELKKLYPIHWAVWEDDVGEIKRILDQKKVIVDIDKADVRGRSPLMLAVTLDRTACARELLARGANADAQNKDMWSVSHEAISTGDERLVQEVIKFRDFQRSRRSAHDMRAHLTRLKDAPDFYAEMCWEFSSWVPFVSKLCPSDTYKIYKRGSSVRIDTTLVGFEGHSWQRGKQTFIFRLQDEDKHEPIPQIIIIDHQTETASIQSLTTDETLEDFDPPEEATHFRMTSPISTTFIDMDRIGFERSKGRGIMSWIGSADKTEKVSGYDCKIFNACNVDLVTKTRTEHLTEEQRARVKQDESSNPLSSLLNMVRSENAADEGPSTSDSQQELGPGQYLDPDFELKHDIGRPRQVSRRSNSFKATLYLAEDYPLSLQDQVAPIVNLMASSSAHFARLNSFMNLQLPAGFPVKILIPLFHVVSAKITFSAINEAGPGVKQATQEMSSVAYQDGVPLLNSPGVEIDAQVFEIPENYRIMDDRQFGASLWWPDEGAATGGSERQPRTPAAGPVRHGRSAQEQEEMLLQLAIEQSLSDMPLQDRFQSSPPQHSPEGEAGGGAPPPPYTPAAGPANGAVRTGTGPFQRSELAVAFEDEERALALAIERSLQDMQQGPSTSSSSSSTRTATNTAASTSDTSLRGGGHQAEALSPRLHAPSPVEGAPPATNAAGGRTMAEREAEMLELAMRLSLEDAERDKARRENQSPNQDEDDEDEELRRVLELSKQEM